MSYSHRIYRPDGTFWVSMFRDDVARTVTAYDESGTVTGTRPYTPIENADADATTVADVQRQVSSQLHTDTAADLVKLKQGIDALAVLLASDTTAGSIRIIMGPATAVAGTTSLRALRAQSNTAVINSTSIKALLGLLIDLAQRDIDAAQATRRVARQTLRLAREMVGDYSSADVGVDI